MTSRTQPEPLDEAPEDGLAQRVHVHVPRVRAQDMVTSQQVTPPPDPQGGRDTEQDFLLRHAGW